MKIRVVRLPMLLPRSADAQVLFPRTIFVRGEVALDIPLLAHELRHVAQIEETGLLYYWSFYLAAAIGYKHHNHPMENEARRAETSPAHRTAAAAILNRIGAHGSGTVIVPAF